MNLVNFISWKNFLYYSIKSITVLVINIFKQFLNLLIEIGLFLSPVVNSVYGKINEEELYRVITLSVSVGGGLFGALTYIANHASEYISDKSTLVFVQTLAITLEKHSSLAIIVIGIFILDFYRRKFHGVPVKPSDKFK